MLSPAKLAATVGAAAGLLTGGLAYAAFYPQSQLLGDVLIAPRRPSELALTFDDGPNPAATPALLDVLARHGVRASFFLIGRHALRHPELTRRIHASGHLLGNHTMTHPKLPFCGHPRIQAEVRDSKRAIEDILGAPLHFFRPPHGARTPYVLRTARELGLTTVQWNIIANDWTALTSVQIADRVTRGIVRNRSGGYASNIVLHDGSQLAVTPDRSRSIAATALLLERYPASGFVTVDAWPLPSRA